MERCSETGCKSSRARDSGFCIYHKQQLEKIVGTPSNLDRLENELVEEFNKIALNRDKPTSLLADLYPKYHKHIPKGWTSIDVYGVFTLFPVKDNSGCIQHALKKLLVPGVRTGGKSFRDDIKEARDTLNRWLELNPE